MGSFEYRMERTSVKDSLNFLFYAKVSCAELYTQVIIGQNVELYSQEDANHFKSESKVIDKMIAALINKRKEFI